MKKAKESYLDIHKNYKCSPSVFYHRQNIFNPDGSFGTCLSTSQLAKLAKAFNKWSRSETIPVDDILRMKNPEESLWKAINTEMISSCENEACWITHPMISLLSEKDREELEYFTFKPKRPTGKNKSKSAWLSNVDIENVLKQYGKIYDFAIFLGPLPIDFAKYFSHYSFNENTINSAIKKGYKCIAIVFNTGTLQSGGKHWVSLFIDLRNKAKPTIEYFDSVGYNPPKEILSVINDIRKSVCPNNGLRCEYINEKIKQLSHQKGNNECGVYSLYFITERLKGTSYEEIQANEMPDKLMFEFRNKFFT